MSPYLFLSFISEDLAICNICSCETYLSSIHKYLFTPFIKEPSYLAYCKTWLTVESKTKLFKKNTTTCANLIGLTQFDKNQLILFCREYLN